MGSEDSLSIADRKTGKAHERLGFDWSGSTNYTRMNREVFPANAAPTSAQIIISLIVSTAESITDSFSDLTRTRLHKMPTRHLDGISRH